MTSKIPLIQKLPKYLSSLPPKVYTSTQLGQIIEDFAKAINDPVDAHPNEYIEYLANQNIFQRITLQGSGKRIELFVIGTASLYEIACSLKPKAYLSHSTAAFIHKLIDKEPKLIYVSAEGPNRPRSEVDLHQDYIDDAFSQKQRMSGTELKWENHRFLLLTAQFSDGLGIEKKEKYTITNLERTLIDMTVRPSYSGGALEILKAYRAALPKLSVKKMVDILEKINFIYPYHQAIGFYLMQAGYTGSILKELRRKPSSYRFYLDYEMKKPLYSKEWNIYYPKNIK